MNFNPAPALPRLWSDYLAWQRSWTALIPGVPDPTTDYSEFQMSEAEARQFFWMDDDQEEGDDMSELSEKIDQVLDNLASIMANQDVTLTKLSEILDNLMTVLVLLDPADAPPVPPTPPPPAPVYWVRVTRNPVANAFVEAGKNAKGFLILKLLEPRVQYKKGEILEVTSAQPLDVDGSYDYFRLAGSTHYLRADQVERI